MTGLGDIFSHRSKRMTRRSRPSDEITGLPGEPRTLEHLSIDVVDIPAPRRFIAVDRLAWARLTTAVIGLHATGPGLQNAGWFLAAAGLSFFVAAISGPRSVELLAFEVVLCATSLILAACMLHCGANAEKEERTRVDDVLRQMREIELTYASNSLEQTLPPSR